MTAKKLISLTVVAALLVVAAYLSANRNTVKTPERIGRSVFSSIDLSRISEIEIDANRGEPLVLSSTDKGWVVHSLYDYPAELTRIREAVLKLDELKVGDISDPSRLGPAPGRVTLKDASGETLAELVLGTKRMRPADDAMAMYGGGPQADGRYVSVGDDPMVLLVSDALESFDEGAEQWVNKELTAIPASDVAAVTITRGDETLAFSKTDGTWSLENLAEDEELDTSSFYPIESALSRLSMTSVVDPQRSTEELGLTTGVVYKAELKNGEYYVATIGNTVDNGTDRYLKLEAGFTPTGTNETVNANAQLKIDTFNTDRGPWTFTISSYNAGQMTKVRADFLKKPETAESEPTEIVTHAEPEAEPVAEAEPEAEPVVEAEAVPEAVSEHDAETEPVSD